MTGPALTAAAVDDPELDAFEAAAQADRVDYEERAAIEGEDGDAAGERGLSEFVRQISLEDCERYPMRPLIRHLAFRQLSTLLSSMGGTGKSRATVQAITEASLGLPVWGCQDFAPIGSQRWLLVAAEDAMPMVCAAVRPVLKHYDLQRAPFDLICAADLPGGRLTLNARSTRSLIEVIRSGGYDGVSFDTLIALLSPEVRIIDPVGVRQWQHATLGAIQRETEAAIWLLAHDNAQGRAVSGTMDWANFGRLVLHLERTEGELRLTATKDNTGFPFGRITLERDPQSLMLRVANLERIVDRMTRAGDTGAALARALQFSVLPLPQEQRTRRAIEPKLCELTKGDGISRQRVRDFIETRVRFEEVKIGRQWAKVAVGLVDAAAEESRA